MRLPVAHPPAGQTGPWNWRLLAFYLLVPLLIGGYGAINNWWLIESAGPAWAIGFYLAHAFPPWFTTCFLSSLTMRVLRPWRPRPWIIMAVGHTASCLVVLPYTNWLIGVFAVRWPGIGLEAAASGVLAAEYWGYWVRAGIVWFAANLLFDHFLGLPRYRYDVVSPRALVMPDAAESTSVAVVPGRPAFLERAPQAVRLADVLAIRAEQHYIRVVTAAKSYLLLHRFGDALLELGAQDGLQVHRSWWVRRNAIQRVRQNSRKMSVVLTNGEIIPVSGPYQALVRQFARASDVPVSGVREPRADAQ